MPEQWNKLLTKSAITREDYAKDPQAVLDVLEFYTDRQKKGDIDDIVPLPITSLNPNLNNLGPKAGSSTLNSMNQMNNLNASASSLTLSPYPDQAQKGAPARFAGTGLGGISSPLGSSQQGNDRPGMKRQDSAPPGLNGFSQSDNLSSAAARAAEVVNGSSRLGGGGVPALQASRPAPPRPLLANRPPPAPPGTLSYSILIHFAKRSF